MPAKFKRGQRVIYAPDRLGSVVFGLKAEVVHVNRKSVTIELVSALKHVRKRVTPDDLFTEGEWQQRQDRYRQEAEQRVRSFQRQRKLKPVAQEPLPFDDLPAIDWERRHGT